MAKSLLALCRQLLTILKILFIVEVFYFVLYSMVC